MDFLGKWDFVLALAAIIRTAITEIFSLIHDYHGKNTNKPPVK